ncbi:MAG TPA: biopolymer transporter ExbD [Opitutaceae bacterium]|nr:biopolymer transporter ExbD [Opitutaceae bacterium]
MALLRKSRRRPELNLVPLIDVLTMLIFFAFVTMQFKTVATLNITLPKVETAGKNEFKGSVTIAVDREGKMTFNGKPASELQLTSLLEAVRNIDRNIPVLIQADQDTPIKNVTFVMDSCRKTGLNKFSLQSR